MYVYKYDIWRQKNLPLRSFCLKIEVKGWFNLWTKFHCTWANFESLEWVGNREVSKPRAIQGLNLKGLNERRVNPFIILKISIS